MQSVMFLKANYQMPTFFGSILKILLKSIFVNLFVISTQAINYFFCVFSYEATEYPNKM